MAIDDEVSLPDGVIRARHEDDGIREILAAAAPGDATEVDLQRYRALQAPWTDWTHVAARGRHWAQVIARVVMEANA